jgi:flagella basal body P-ring formation protein FlgA
MWLVSLAPLLLVAAECLPLRTDVVTAADLAAVVPAFGQLPAATQVGLAPAPGVTRWIAPGELVRIGRQQGLTVAAVGVCLFRVVETLDRARVLAAMQTAGPSFEIELLSFGPGEVPPGEIEFRSRALPPVPRQAGLPIVFWRGRLVGETGRAFPVWARARIMTRRRGLVMRHAVRAGQTIDDGAVEQVELTDYPGWAAPLADKSLVLGRRARRAIAARAPLTAQLLRVRREVERGDSVTVTLPGEATLTAQAESPGRKGEMILLKNPLTGRRFSSKVTGVGQAVVAAETKPAHPEGDDDRP